MLLAYAVTGYLQVNVWDVSFLSNYKWGGLSRGWSLSTEEQFYIVVPLLLIVPGPPASTLQVIGADIDCAN